MQAIIQVIMVTIKKTVLKVIVLFLMQDIKQVIVNVICLVISVCFSDLSVIGTLCSRTAVGLGRWLYCVIDEFLTEYDLRLLEEEERAEIVAKRKIK